MELLHPGRWMEAAYHDYMAEWDRAGEEMVPHAARLLGMTYPQWLESLRAFASADTCPEGWVPATTLFLMEEGEILGTISIRHTLNDYLALAGGHIGYGVRPSARGKGYAKAMLSMALPVAKGLGIDRALVTCDKDNTASARTILACGGALENEIEHEGKQVQRYWINCQPQTGRTTCRTMIPIDT